VISGKVKPRVSMNSNDPIVEVNKFGYNPALERRLSYKFLPLGTLGGKSIHLNINYML
jgi:hypothetical protein